MYHGSDRGRRERDPEENVEETRWDTRLLHILTDHDLDSSTIYLMFAISMGPIRDDELHLENIKQNECGGINVRIVCR